MKKIIYSFMFLLGLFGMTCFNGVDVSAAITKEYNINTNICGDIRYDLGNLDDDIDEEPEGVTATVSVSNPAVADAYADFDVDYKDYGISTKSLGQTDITFTISNGNQYIVHLTVTPATYKAKTVQLIQGRKISGEEIEDTKTEETVNYSDIKSVRYSQDGIVKISKTSHDNYSVSALKPGIVTVTLELEPQYDEDDDCTYFTNFSFKVQVYSLSQVKKEAAKQAKVLAAKRTKDKINYIDLNGDGLKELVIGKKIYFLNCEGKIKFEYDYEGGSKVYISKKTKCFMTESKDSKGVYTTIYGKDRYIRSGFTKLTSKGKKFYGTKSSYTTMTDGGFDIISTSRVKKDMKKYMPSKKAVKMYKNTAAYRNKLIK